MKEVDNTFYTAADVARIIHRSENHAYKLIAELNKELSSQGYLTVRARIPKAYFEKRLLGFSAGGDRE